MIELQLIGYTADLRSLVLRVGEEGGTRFKVPVDPDLLATLGEILDLSEPEVTAGLLEALGPGRLAELADGAAAGSGKPDVLGAQGVIALLHAAAAGVVPDALRRQSKLTPREIQRLLRAGRSVEAVARQADADVEWIRRWYRPIAAEQDQVIAAVHGSFQARSRLGQSRESVGNATRFALRERGVDPDDDEQVAWTASRHDESNRWTVSLRFRAGDVWQEAEWRYDAGTGRTEPGNDLAGELGWTRPRTGRHAEPTAEDEAADDDALSRPPRSLRTPGAPIPPLRRTSGP